MKVILGIGNIGERYQFTKHNIGFIILDRLADKLNNPIIKIDKHFLYCTGNFDNNDYLFLKPTTYVNKSGDAAFDIYKQNNVDISDILVISDDINLDLGKIRIRQDGGDGGHNGIASIIHSLEDDKFPRIRFGIGGEFNDGSMADYVLSEFNEAEFKKISPRINYCGDLILEFISGGIKAMLDNFSRNSDKFNSPLINI